MADVTREDLRRMRALGYRRYLHHDGHRPRAWELRLEDGVDVALYDHGDQICVTVMRWGQCPACDVRYCFRSMAEALDCEPLVISALRTMAGVISATQLVVRQGKEASHG